MRIICVLFLFPIICFGQSSITLADRQSANSFYIASDWPKAIAAYRKISAAEPQNWNALTRLGASLTENGQANEAIKPLQEAVKIGNNNQPMFYLAVSYASIHQNEPALHWLDQAVKNGFAQLPLFDGSKPLNELKADARYTAIRETMLHSIYPCRFSEKAREFDFWLGEWDVRNTQGATAGKSRIERMLGDCVIYENWTSAVPNLYEGKSFNLYNSATQKWMQTWVDDKGGLLEFIDGEFNDGKMVFITRPDLKNQITRLTFYNLNPDLVRQHFETTNDSGKTWTTTTDLQYHRIK